MCEEQTNCCCAELDLVDGGLYDVPWYLGQSSAHPLSIDLIFLASLRC